MSLCAVGNVIRSRHARPQDAVDHCVWLARYERLVRDDVMHLYDTEPIGCSGTGKALLIFDEEPVVLVLGRLACKFNHRALSVANARFGAVAHSYAQSLATNAEQVEPQEFGHFFRHDRGSW